MKITELSVQRPVTTVMVFLGLIFAGLMAFSNLAVSLMPDLKLPYMTVTTTNFGASPEEIEVDITKRIEKELADIQGIKNIQSWSMADVSIVSLEFKTNVKVDMAKISVKEKLDKLMPDFPFGTDKPIVENVKYSGTEVITLVASGGSSYRELSEYVDNVLESRLLRIDGVAKIEKRGYREREIKLFADPLRLRDLSLNIDELSNMISGVNRKMASGEYTAGDRKFSVETGQRFTSLRAIEEASVSTSSGPMRIGDILKIEDGEKKPQTRSLFYDMHRGQRDADVISLAVEKESDANTVEIAEKVKSLVLEMRDEHPGDITISIPQDMSEYTRSSVNDAVVNVILGILLTGFVLMFFLGDYRTTLIAAISIPVSLIGTLAAMKIIGASLNMMTLMSFAVAIGALISNSIVVVENILRHNGNGRPIREAAVEGTREVTMAVIASTGTNLVVFLPIASMQSITGLYFREYALTITAATVFSLLVSFTLTPTLASLLFARQREKSRFQKGLDRLFHKMESGYERSLAALIANRRRPVYLFLTMTFLFLLSTGLLRSIGFEMEPAVDTGTVNLGLEFSPGTSLDETTAMVQRIEDKIKTHGEVKNTLSTVGLKDPNTRGSNYALISVNMIPEKERNLSHNALAELIYEELNAMPEVVPFVNTGWDISTIPVSFMLGSDDQDALDEANALVMRWLGTLPGVLNFESSERDGGTVIRIRPRLDELAELGLSPELMVSMVRGVIKGIKTGSYIEGGKKYDLLLSYEEKDVNSVDKIRSIPLYFGGVPYRIDQLADLSLTQSRATIYRSSKTRTVVYSLIPEDGVVMGDVQKMIATGIHDLTLPPAVRFSWSAAAQDLEETTAEIIITFIIAIVLMYMLLASLLENLWHPLIIFTTIPVSLIGVFVLMFLSGTTMNIMSMMAVITLLGLVVNDNILIRDYTMQLSRRGRPMYEAVLEAGRTKMKTVIMTSVAIIAGMLPNALGLGDKGASYRIPAAIVAIGGMVTATILSLYLIPSLFYILSGEKKEDRGFEIVLE